MCAPACGGVAPLRSRLAKRGARAPARLRLNPDGRGRLAGPPHERAPAQYASMPDKARRHPCRRCETKSGRKTARLPAAGPHPCVLMNGLQQQPWAGVAISVPKRATRHAPSAAVTRRPGEPPRLSQPAPSSVLTAGRDLTRCGSIPATRGTGEPRGPDGFRPRSPTHFRTGPSAYARSGRCGTAPVIRAPMAPDSQPNAIHPCPGTRKPKPEHHRPDPGVERWMHILTR